MLVLPHAQGVACPLVAFTRPCLDFGWGRWHVDVWVVLLIGRCLVAHTVLVVYVAIVACVT